MRLPLYIDFEGKKVVVIGGGGVGTVRAKKFVEAGANVTVFSLEFSDELLRMSEDGKVSLVKADVGSINLDSILKDANLVVVAIGNKDYNRKIMEIAAKHKTLVNLANDADGTEVVVPFEGEKRGIRFSVTTEGKSGVVARRVRDAILRMLEEDEETFYFLNAMEHLKKYMKAKEIPVNVRMKLYSAVSTDTEFRKLVREERIDEARKYAEMLVEDYVSGKKDFRTKNGLEF
jgi:precorrin-2 dehydrogenase/sirohydrochlorin ferrochelatase